MLKTLLLDLDGTLVDSVPDLLAACNRLLVPRGLAPLTRAEITPMIGDGAAALLRKAMAARQQQPHPADVEAFLADYTAHAAEATRAYPGVPETLDRLAAAGWTLAICTNKPEAATRELLDRLGLLHRFAAIGAGDTYPVRKPDPAHLLHTLADAGGRPDRAVMVGDHHNDVAAAEGAGIPCIFALWGYGPAGMGDQAAATAQRFPMIPNLAEQLLGSLAAGSLPAG